MSQKTRTTPKSRKLMGTIKEVNEQSPKIAFVRDLSVMKFPTNKPDDDIQQQTSESDDESQSVRSSDIDSEEEEKTIVEVKKSSYIHTTLGYVFHGQYKFRLTKKIPIKTYFEEVRITKKLLVRTSVLQLFFEKKAKGAAIFEVDFESHQDQDRSRWRSKGTIFNRQQNKSRNLSRNASPSGSQTNLDAITLRRTIKTLDEEDEEKIKPRHLKRMVTLTNHDGKGSSSEAEKDKKVSDKDAFSDEEEKKKQRYQNHPLYWTRNRTIEQSARINPPSLKKQVQILVERGLFYLYQLFDDEKTGIIVFEDEDGTIRRKLSPKALRKIIIVSASVSVVIVFLLLVFFLSLLQVNMRFQDGQQQSEL